MSDDRGDGSDDRESDGRESDDREERAGNGDDSAAAPQPASAAARRERRADATRPAGRADRTRPAAAPKERSARGRDTSGSPPARLLRFLREVIAELRKVIWPTRRELVTYTTVVLFFVVIMVAFVWLLDQGFQRAVFYVFG